MSIARKSKCIICGVRKGKRDCPREEDYICTKCCGETRDMKECPKTCEYLQPLLKQKGKLAEIKRAYLSEDEGVNSLIIEHRNSSGKWSSCISIIDLWKRGYEHSDGVKNVSEEEIDQYLAFYKEMYNFERIKWKKALQLLKRGLDIRKELQLAYPNGYYKFKDILAKAEEIGIEGTVYKCADCGGDLPEENIEELKAIAWESEDLDEEEDETMEYMFCKECDKKRDDKIRDFSKKGNEIFKQLLEEVTSNIQKNSSPQLTQQYKTLIKQGNLYKQIVDLLEFNVDKDDVPELKNGYEFLIKEGYSREEAISKMAVEIVGETLSNKLIDLNETEEMMRSEGFFFRPVDCSECQNGIVCPTCNSNEIHGWDVVGEVAILCDRCGTLFLCKTLEIIEKLTREDKEQMEEKALSKIADFFGIERTDPRTDLIPVKTIKLQKEVEIDKSDPIYKLVHRINIVDEKKGKFGNTIQQMEKKHKPITKSILKKGREAVPALVAHLYNFDSWACLFAVKLLGEIKDERAIESIMDVMEVPYGDYINEEAMFAIVKYGELAVDPLIERITARIKTITIDENGVELHGFYLLEALGKIQLPKVYSFLENLLVNRREYPNLDLISLVNCFWDQKNPAILPELEQVVREYGTNGIGREAMAIVEELRKFR